MRIVKRLALIILTMQTIVCSQYAQSGLNIKGGLLNYQYSEEQGRHYGQSIGLDAVVQDTRFLFMAGFHYQQYTILSSTSRDGFLVGGDKIHQIQVPVNAGLLVLNDRLFKLRAYAGGHVSFIVGVDDNTVGLSIDRVKEFQPGVQAGIQCMLWRITADVRYIADFRNVIPSRQYETKLRGWEILVGIAL